MISTTILALGSIGFWLVVIPIALVIFFFVEYEKPGWATFTMALTFVALAAFGNFNLWEAVKNAPLQAIEAVVAYFLFGALWSVAKWWFFVRRRRAKYDDLKEGFARGRGLTEPYRTAAIPVELRWEFKELLDEHPEVKKPLLRENKGRNIMWMMYWPWSFLWTLASDLVKKVWHFVYSQFQGWYQAIADRAYRGVDKDVEGATPPSSAATDLSGGNQSGYRGTRRPIGGNINI